MPIYARHGVTELWIVALNEQVVEVYRTPEAAGYADVQVARRGNTIAPLALPKLELTVDGILG